MTSANRTIYRLPPYRVHRCLRALSETIDWGLRSNGIPSVWRRTQGEGVRIAVLDTGVDTRHEDLVGGISEARDFTGSRSGPRDRQGHGTHVAGTIAARQNQRGVVGVAPRCELLIGKVLDDGGAGSDRDVAAGIEWAVAQRADIISMSLGSSEPSQGIGTALRDAAGAGVLVISAAGNDGRRNSVNFPARRREAIAVAAVDRDGRIAPFSSRGEQVDIAAPGVDILSTWPRGQYARLSGTSMATPFVSGVVALMLAAAKGQGDAERRDVAWLRTKLSATAIDAGASGKDTSYGWGLIRPESLLRGDTPAPPLGWPELRIRLSVNGEPAELVLARRGEVSDNTLAPG